METKGREEGRTVQPQGQARRAWEAQSLPTWEYHRETSTDPSNPGRPRRGQWADGWGQEGQGVESSGPRESMTHSLSPLERGASGEFWESVIVSTA